MAEILLVSQKNRNNAFVVDDIEINVFKPCLGNLRIENEKLSIRGIFVRLYFYVISCGKFRIYYVCDNSKKNIIHTSYVMPKCIKFPFLKRHECVIGPCWTYDECRGKGIYPKVLMYIASTRVYDNCYIVVSEENIPSMRGVCKAGYKKCGYITIVGFLKIYRAVFKDE